MEREEKIANIIVSKAISAANGITITEPAALEVSGTDLNGKIYLKNVKATIERDDFIKAGYTIKNYIQSIFQAMSKSAPSWNGQCLFSVKDNSFVAKITFKAWKDKNYTIKERVADIAQAVKRI